MHHHKGTHGEVSRVGMGMGNFRKGRKPNTKALAAKKSEQIHKTTAQRFEKYRTKRLPKGCCHLQEKQACHRYFLCTLILGEQ